MPTFGFTIDGDNYTTAEHELTAWHLLQMAGLDAAN